MEKPKKDVVWLGIIAVLVCILCMPLVSAASGLREPEPALVDSSDRDLPDGLSTEGIPAEVESEPIIQATPWGTPVQVSPNNGTALYHYPRQVTLAWNRVVGATSYQVERAYLSGSTWVSYPVVTVSGYNNASYTFSFVGDQQGRWRVRAYKPYVYTSWSPYWTFSFRTKAQMPTPVLTNPYPEEVFDHYPRTVTLAWKMLPAAYGYKVEIEYCDSTRTTCWSYTPVNRTGYLTSWYTFDFVGAQPGRWRVTALGGTSYYDSAPSAWRWFRFGI